jgi:TonB-dependent starch-binding outer membrane protein SusC
VTVSYTLPVNIVNTVGAGHLSSARISLNGYNMWSIFHYDGLDPETTTVQGLNVRAAGEVTPYPPSRSYYIGLDLGL